MSVCQNCGREVRYPLVAGMCRSCTNPVREVFWTRERILAALRRWAELHGGPPTSGMWRRAGEWWPSMPTVVLVFGKWNNAIREAGLEPFAGRGLASRRQPHVRSGWLSLEGSGVTPRLYRYREQHGVKVEAPPRRDWTPELIIEALQRWARETGGPPTAEMWRHPYEWWPASSTVVKHVGGSWNKALLAAGFTPRSAGGNTTQDPALIAGRAKVREAQRAVEPLQERRWGRGVTSNGVSDDDS